MAVAAGLPGLGTVLATAAVDSINPCAIGVLILLISTLLMLSHNRKKMLGIALVYILSIYVVYFLAGLGLMAFLSFIPLTITEYITLTVALIVIAGGILEIKDYFWYGAGLSLRLTGKNVERIKKYAHSTSLPSVIFLGAFVAAVELPCTCGPYLAITALLAQNFNLEAIYLLLIYNVIFVMPLIVILLAVYFGTNLKKIEQWKGNYKGYMRLATGMIMVGLGILLMLIANGTINLN